MILHINFSANEQRTFITEIKRETNEVQWKMNGSTNHSNFECNIKPIHRYLIKNSPSNIAKA